MQEHEQFSNSRNHMQQNEQGKAQNQRLELEGECKIKNFKLLDFSYLKTSLFFLPLIFSIIGLFLLKYYKSLRAKVLYWEADRQMATHIYIKGNGKRQEEIVEIQRHGNRIIFYYKKLKYELLAAKALPVGINYERQLKNRLETNFIKTGLSQQEVQQRRNYYGKNQHIVDPPQYYQYLYEVMTEPFFFIQYLAAVIYIIQKLPELAFLLLGSSVITTSINYILLYISYRKIKQMAERVIQIDVLREGKFQTIPSNNLVPGDLFVPNQELYCDSILLRGELYVNEANLTGESVPIGKFPIKSYRQWNKSDNSKWIYEGSKILSSHNTLAMVVHIGYGTKRGRILRRILHKTVTVSHLFTTCLYFLSITYGVAVIIYLATMKMRIDNGIVEGLIIFLHFLLIVTLCFPPGCPIYFNLVYSFCLMRLKWNNILGTDPQKTVESANLKIMCFDKTGTLTEDKVQVNSVYKLQQDSYRQITGKRQQQKGLDFKIFGSCHTVREFKKELKGDEIDLKMFLHSGYRLRASKDQSVCFEVDTIQTLKFSQISVLKIHQYESKFQSMSVLVYDHQTCKHYVFVKGAPQIIHNYSIKKYSYFDSLLQNVSYGGYRTIAYGYKEIPENMKATYMSQTRQNYLKGINILGLLVFQNKLKGDAYDTISMLRHSGIQSKIITGDNIYIAIETAIRCRILSRSEELVLIEGKQQINDGVNYGSMKITVKYMKFQQQSILIKKQTISFNQYINLEKSIVVDNDFLKATENQRMNKNVKVYARISPQNKAAIIRKIKGQIEKQRKKIPKCQRIFSNQMDRVGMVGDGANDLLAIREADIGIGIRNCDSSYAASFSIEFLQDIDYIIRQAKCGQRQIVEIVRFISITSFISVPLLIIMETEGTYFSSLQLIFGNLTKYIILNILLALTRPAEIQTIYKACSNFLQIENQLVYWGNVILGSMGHIAIMIYYRSTPEYQWNFTKITLDSGWATKTSLVASQYMFYTIHPIILVIAIYMGEPFKQPLHKNFLLFIVIIGNIVFTMLLFGIYPQLQGFFGFVDISYPCLGYIAIICVVDSILILMFNGWIRYMKFHERLAIIQSPLGKKEEETVHDLSSSQG